MRTIFLLCAIIAMMTVGIAVSLHTIQKKNQEISILNQEISSLNEENKKVRENYSLISQSLQSAAIEKKKAEDKSNAAIKKIRELQKDVECAKYPVPDDVIGMQRDSVNEINRKYSAPSLHVSNP